ncbi:MAG: hypothetical protein H5U33_04880, partial [Pseudomonas sp.]|nr:hypothetical protein [Pseudomonas sp.]
LAGWQALLHRYSGQGDIRVGVPNANRPRLETQGMVGFFINTQVLRARTAGRGTPPRCWPGPRCRTRPGPAIRGR